FSYKPPTTTPIYTLSLHDALPIFDFAMMVGGFRSDSPVHAYLYAQAESYAIPSLHIIGKADRVVPSGDSRILAAQFGTTRSAFRSEEHTSELQSRGHLVCRLLLEK